MLVTLVSQTVMGTSIHGASVGSLKWEMQLIRGDDTKQEQWELVMIKILLGLDLEVGPFRTRQLSYYL